MFKWLSRWYYRKKLGYIKWKYREHQRVIVPNTPKCWQDLESGQFFVGDEIAFRNRWFLASRGISESNDYIIGVACYVREANLVLTALAPYRHHHLVWLAKAIGLRPPLTRDQGFLTIMGRYVRREEGLEIAKRMGQLIRKTGGDRELFSEDLWDIPEELNINKPKKGNTNDTTDAATSPGEAAKAPGQGSRGVRDSSGADEETPCQEDDRARTG